VSATETSGVVTLLSDFGSEDPFVGVMKGVILTGAPLARLIDVTHAVPPQDVELAGFFLSASFAWFPRGSVHLAVVDPGVGSERKALAVRASGHYFLAPDNGLLSRVLETDAGFEARAIDSERLGLGVPSRTFHGRDVFAPTAARLVSGAVRFEALGALSTPLRNAPGPAPSSDSGRIVAVDHFGNLISDLRLESGETRALAVEIGGRRARVVGTYADGGAGECIALVSSFGTLEIAVRDGNAARLLALGRGAPIRLLRGGSP
jgi:S-adenosylmethionine hydrolase